MSLQILELKLFWRALEDEFLWMQHDRLGPRSRGRMNGLLLSKDGRTQPKAVNPTRSKHMAYSIL